MKSEATVCGLRHKWLSQRNCLRKESTEHPGSAPPQRFNSKNYRLCGDRVSTTHSHCLSGILTTSVMTAHIQGDSVSFTGTQSDRQQAVLILFNN